MLIRFVLEPKQRYAKVRWEAFLNFNLVLTDV